MRFICRRTSAALGLALLLAACQPGEQSGEPGYQQVSHAFVSKVVVPNYRQLVQGSQELSAALNALAATPGKAQLEAAREAWRQLRSTWETSESWAFGPAETGGFDANLDDWPVNEKDLSTALASGTLTPDLFARLTTTAKGFHGIEAVLYGTDGQGSADRQLNAVELAFLRQAGADLAENAQGLLNAWEGPQGFGANFTANAEEAVAEIVQGMVGTLEEVAAEKLGAPLASRKAGDLESSYSDNTRADIVANLGGVHEAMERSGLLDLIAGRDAQLARLLKQSLAEAESSARALPVGLNGALDDTAGRTKIQAVIQNSERSAALLKQAAARLA
jgi:predicted lipoprotein